MKDYVELKSLTTGHWNYIDSGVPVSIEYTKGQVIANSWKEIGDFGLAENMPLPITVVFNVTYMHFKDDFFHPICISKPLITEYKNPLLKVQLSCYYSVENLQELKRRGATIYLPFNSDNLPQLSPSSTKPTDQEQAPADDIPF